MKRLGLILFGCIQICKARQPGFSIHEDLLAHPQFEVVFSDAYILERDVQHLLDNLNNAGATTYGSGLIPPDTDLATPSHKSASAVGSSQSAAPSKGSRVFEDGEDGDGSEQVSETYEVVNVPPSRYLCAIPVLAPPPAPNQTATDLAKAEEAKEMSRVSVRGVELVNSLHGECMYYVSGWWSYSFCYGSEIVQFHALTMKSGKPVKDQQSQEYILGRMLEVTAGKKEHQQKKTQNSDLEVQKPSKGNDGDPKDIYDTELQVKGDQKYMVQHLGAGTICDLTNRERTIEIQYHCNPGGTSDRISWIKEVTTCSYLMEVRTPRLCKEAAFLPPKPTRAHPISCQLIVGSEEEATKQLENTIEPRESEIQQPQKVQTQQDLEYAAQEVVPDVVVGGVTIGARQALRRGQEGQAPLKLEALRIFDSRSGHNGRVVQVLARAVYTTDGGKVEMLSDEELVKLDLNPQALATLVEKLESIANGKAWKVEALEIPGKEKLEIRAIIESEDSEEQETNTKSSEDGSEGHEGSEETFKKDEL